MFDRELQKHAGEFGRYLRNRQFEVTDDGGIHFARASAVAQGGYIHDVNGLDERFDKNLLPDEGLIYLLSVGLIAADDGQPAATLPAKTPVTLLGMSGNQYYVSCVNGYGYVAKSQITLSSPETDKP